jgi:hypothetical protein
MAISAYPRVAVQGTTAANNPPNGQSLMLFNSTTQQYEPATAATFSGGGGGGGDATAANQSTQITEAQSTNTLISETILNQAAQINEAQISNNYLNEGGVSVASLLNLIYNTLKDIKNNQTNNTQTSQIFGDGNLAHVTASNELVTKNNA